MENKSDLENDKEEIMHSVRKSLYYNNLLIEQCNSWLSAEEGNKNMMKKIMKQAETGKLINF